MQKAPGAGARSAGKGDSLGGDAAEADELLLEEIVSELPRTLTTAAAADSPSTLTAPPATPVEVAHLEAELHAAFDRDEVARLALRLARRYARAAALFVVNRGVVAGLRAEADGLEHPVDGILVPADGDSFFAAPLKSGEAHRSGTASSPMDARILHAMGRGGARDRMIAPVTIGGRVVNLLYADNGPEALATTSAAALRALAAAVGAAYERLIVARKRPIS